MAKTLKPGEKPTNTVSPWFLQGSMLVAVDVETTGLDCSIHEIYQIALIALDYDYKPREDVRPFSMSMRIESPETINFAELSRAGIKRDKLELHTLHGVDQINGVDLLLKWVDTLGLAPNRRLCPVAQNWPFDRGFIDAWLGKELFNSLFHPHYRDLIPACQVINDIYFMKGDQPPFRDGCNLAALCKYFSVEQIAKHEALNDAAATAEVYRRFIKKFTSNFGGL